MNNKIHRHKRRSRRVRGRFVGTDSRPRMSVYRSNKHIYVQLIDDASGKTLVSCSDSQLKNTKGTGVEIAHLVGEELAAKAQKAKISEVIFDRGGYRYHGRVKSMAEGARKGGLSL